MNKNKLFKRKNTFLKKEIFSNKIKIFYMFIIIFVLVMNQSTVIAQEKDKVVLQLRWVNQYQFAGYYAAQWFGYYDEEGLDVEIRTAFNENGEILNAIEEVSRGRADFGIGASDILIAENNGEDLCVISSLFQRSAVEFYMKKDTPYRSIYDLTKLNTARRKNDLLDIELQAMLKSEGIDSNSSDFCRWSFCDKKVNFSIEDLSSDKYDVIPGYMNTIPYYADKAGIELKVIKPIDYGIDFYGDSLFTKRKFAYDNPELVERFRRASMKGWEYALEHPEEIIQSMTEKFKIKGESQRDFIEFNEFQAKKIAEITLYPVVELGNINPYRWSKMQEILVELNLVNGKVDIDNFVFDYTRISNEKYFKLEKFIIALLFIGFIICISLFFFYLALKNKKLENEIVERKRAEYKILKSNQTYEAMINSAILGITITTKDGVIIKANDKWLQMTGYCEEDVIERNISQFVVYDESNGFNDIKKFSEGKISSCEVERQYIKKDGSILWAKLFIVSVHDNDNDIERKVNLGMIIDITNSKIAEETVKRSERRFRKIIKEVASEISDIENVQNILLDDDFEMKDDNLYGRNKLSLKLEKINLELERMFKNELDENKRKEALIIYQARFAAMGEMIANIAHQWRQPLNNLGLVLSNIEDAYLYNELDSDYLHSSVERSRRLISKMSETIDDFRYFSNPTADKQEFEIYENIKSVLDLVEENLRFHNIKVRFENIIMCKVYGYANQYSQAIFNIINNSIDALVGGNIENKEICISIFEYNDMVAVEFKDNGGGISEEISDKIFDVYFTTKQGSNGTGLGLYMTKSIIENNMNGKIDWRNTENGVSMQVAVPKERGVEHGGC